MAPSNFEGTRLWAAKYDDSFTSTLTSANLKAYQTNMDNFDQVSYTYYSSPYRSWAVPLVTGHKYRFLWDKGQLNWTKMQIEVSAVWQPTDTALLLNYPYTDNYEVIDFFGKYSATFANDGSGPRYYPNGQLSTTNPPDWLSGMNTLNIIKRELTFAITGHPQSSKTLAASPVKCRLNQASWCVATKAVECSGTPLNWSNPTTWGGSLPSNGDDIEIPAGKIIVFDLENSPQLGLLKIVGCLQFLNDDSKD